MRKDLDLYVGGEDTFCYRWFPAPPGAPETERQTFGVLDRRDLDKANVQVVMAEEPMVIGDQAFTTGAIARTTFETVQPAAQIELGQRDGAGCDASHFTPAEQAGQIVPDQFWYEHATCFNVKDRGLVVISSCGHAGIVNTVKAAQAASGVEKVHAVIGGFHLAPCSRAVRRPDGGSPQGDQPRLPDPDALQRQNLHPPRRCGDARKDHPELHRQPVHLRRRRLSRAGTAARRTGREQHRPSSC